MKKYSPLLLCLILAVVGCKKPEKELHPLSDALVINRWQMTERTVTQYRHSYWQNNYQSDTYDTTSYTDSGDGWEYRFYSDGMGARFAGGNEAHFGWKLIDGLLKIYPEGLSEELLWPQQTGEKTMIWDYAETVTFSVTPHNLPPNGDTVYSYSNVRTKIVAKVKAG